MEDLKERYYAVQRDLLVRRAFLLTCWDLEMLPACSGSLPVFHAVACNNLLARCPPEAGSCCCSPAM